MCTPDEREAVGVMLLGLRAKESELRQRAEAAERKVLYCNARLDGLEARLELLDALEADARRDTSRWLD